LHRILDLPRRKGRDDPYLGKTVSINRGPWKGYIGVVKEANANIARVELHSKPKIIPVERNYLTILEYFIFIHFASCTHFENILFTVALI
jgi:transcription elongation factor SPT5